MKKITKESFEKLRNSFPTLTAESLRAIQVKKTTLLLFISFFVLFAKGYGRSIEEVMEHSMGIERRTHEDFVLDGKIDCFDSIPRLKEMLTCKDNQYNSKDGHVKIFMGTFVMTREDSVSYASFLPQKAIIPVNTQHIYQIIGDIRTFHGYTQEEAKGRWREYVHYFTQEEARRICNADTVISYTLALDENEFYGRYKYIAVYYMQKYDRGNVGIYCFYDDEAAKNPEKYMRNILGMFHYMEPFTKKTLPEKEYLFPNLPKHTKQPLRENDVLREIIERHEKKESSE
jgi:hypothetical protein